MTKNLLKSLTDPYVSNNNESNLENHKNYDTKFFYSANVCMIKNFKKNSSDMASISKADLRINKNEQSFLTGDLANDFQSIIQITDERDALKAFKSPRRELYCLADNYHGSNTSAKVGVVINLENSTPDILIKDYKYLENMEFKSENGPDLLQSVQSNLNLIMDSGIMGDFKLEYKNESFPGENNNCNKNLTSNICMNTSDIDPCGDKEDFDIIIGDFEQEVEREFGLFVSGYNCLVGGNIIPDSIKYQNGLTTKEIRDAVLSNGMERITEEKIKQEVLKRDTRNTLETIKVIHKLECLKENTHKIDARSQFNITSTDRESQLTNNCRNIGNIPSRHFSEKEQLKLIQIRERLPNLCLLSEKTSQGDNHIHYNEYKKHSYDERQLPPVGIDYKCQVRKIQTSCRSQYSDKQINGLKENFSRLSFASENNRRDDEEEFHQYQELISCNKDFIISRSKYSKMSIWAQYLENSQRNTNADELINSQRKNISLRACRTDINASLKNYEASQNRFKSKGDNVRNVWIDYKCYIKRKLSINKLEAKATGGGSNKMQTFNNLEEAVIRMTGLETSTSGIKGCRKIRSENFNVVSVTQEDVEEEGLLKEVEDAENNCDISMRSQPAFDQLNAKTTGATAKSLVQQQISLQEGFYEKTLDFYKRQEERLEIIATSLKRLNRVNEKMFELQKENLGEIRRHNREMEVLLKKKLDIKAQMLEIELKRM